MKGTSVGLGLGRHVGAELLLLFLFLLLLLDRLAVLAASPAPLPSLPLPSSPPRPSWRRFFLAFSAFSLSLSHFSRAFFSFSVYSSTFSKPSRINLLRAAVRAEEDLQVGALVDEHLRARLGPRAHGDGLSRDAGAGRVEHERRDAGLDQLVVDRIVRVDLARGRQRRRGLARRRCRSRPRRE